MDGVHIAPVSPLLARDEKTSGTKKAIKMRYILVALLLLSACEVNNTTPTPSPAGITRSAACAETGQAFCARLTQCAAITVSDCLAQYLPACCSGADCSSSVDAASSSACAAGFAGFPCASLMASQVPAACQ